MTQTAYLQTWMSVLYYTDWRSLMHAAIRVLKAMLGTAPELPWTSDKNRIAYSVLYKVMKPRNLEYTTVKYIRSYIVIAIVLMLLYYCSKENPLISSTFPALLSLSDCFYIGSPRFIAMSAHLAIPVILHVPRFLLTSHESTLLFSSRLFSSF